MTAGERLLSAAHEMRATVAESARACSCSSDDCRENGCGILRREKEAFLRDTPARHEALGQRLLKARQAITKQSPETRANLAGRFKVD